MSAEPVHLVLSGFEGIHRRNTFFVSELVVSVLGSKKMVGGSDEGRLGWRMEVNESRVLRIINGLVVFKEFGGVLR